MHIQAIAAFAALAAALPAPRQLDGETGTKIDILPRMPQPTGSQPPAGGQQPAGGQNPGDVLPGYSPAAPQRPPNYLDTPNALPIYQPRPIKVIKSKKHKQNFVDLTNPGPGRYTGPPGGGSGGAGGSGTRT